MEFAPEVIEKLSTQQKQYIIDNNEDCQSDLKFLNKLAPLINPYLLPISRA